MSHQFGSLTPTHLSSSMCCRHSRYFVCLSMLLTWWSLWLSSSTQGSTSSRCCKHFRETSSVRTSGENNTVPTFGNIFNCDIWNIVQLQKQKNKLKKANNHTALTQEDAALCIYFSNLLYILFTCLSWLETSLPLCISSVKAQPAFSAADRAAETFKGIELDAVTTWKTPEKMHGCTFRPRTSLIILCIVFVDDKGLNSAPMCKRQ